MSLSAFPGIDRQAEAPETVISLRGQYPVAVVDLMPAQIRAARRFRRTRLWLVGAVGVTVVAAACAAVVARAGAAEAEAALLAEQQVTAQLNQQRQQFDDVPAVLGTIERAQTSLRSAMGQEVAWYPQLDEIARSVPDGVSLNSVTLTYSDPATAAATNPLATPGAVAGISISGEAADHEGVVAWLRAMAGLADWSDPVFSQSSRPQDATAVEFTATAALADSAYSGRFADGLQLGTDDTATAAGEN